MNDLVISVVPSVELVHGQPMVSSRAVSQHFRKSHKHVLRDIKALDCSEAFRQSNFGPSNYVDTRGKEQPGFDLTRDGFVFLVMGYSGPQAARLKEAYIQRFNELDARFRVSASDMAYHQRCERDLIRTQRKCIKLQGRMIRMLGKQVHARPPEPASTQGELFAQGGAA